MENGKKQPRDNKIEELEKLAAEYLDGWKRCKADFENYKKQQQDWANSFRQYAAEDIFLEIIPVVDNFELAVNHIPQTPENESWLEGISHIKKQLEAILASHNVKIIEVKQGDAFDPSSHECVEGTTKDKCENKLKEKQTPVVDKIIRSGYTVGEKLLRPAQVTIKYN